MAETKTDNRTRAAGADMRQGGMPQGQAPAVRQPPRRETAMEARAREKREAAETFVTLLHEHRADVERSLRSYDIAFDTFVAAVEIGMAQGMKNDDDFPTGDPAAFLQACLRAAHVGLKPDGKQGAVVRYGKDYSFLPMVEGYIEILWKTGIVADINHNVVCDGDDFEFEEGDEGYVKHKRSLTRPAEAAAIGAWCVINLLTRQGAKVLEVVDQADLKKIAAVSKATKGPRAHWEREMHRKAPFRRAVKRMPKTERLSVLIAIDDANVELERLSAPKPEPEVPTEALFANKPAVRRRRQERPVADLPAPEELPTREEPKDERGPEDGAGIMEPLPDDSFDDEETAAPFVLRAIISTKNGVQDYDAKDPQSVDFWYGDLRQKMRNLQGEQLQAFWAKNRGYIEDAGKNGFSDQAIKLVTLATELNLMGDARG